MEKKNLNRRNFFKTGLGAMGALVASKSLAQACGIVTGQQPLGPFFPSSGSAEDVIREDPNLETPMYLANDNDLTFVQDREGAAEGQVVYINGRVSDENCGSIANATLVVWQASFSGRYNHKGDNGNEDFEHPLTGEVIERTLDPFFQYWGQTMTDENGEYQFKTIVPGFYPADLENGWYRPPHIHFLVSATGYPQLVTQMYFEGKDLQDNDWIQELNDKDFLLQNSSLSVEQREELIVSFQMKPVSDELEALSGQFDIALTR